MPMSRIRITSLDDESVIYEGAGELVLGSRPGYTTNLLADGVVIRQEERRGGEVRSRQIDLTELVREASAEYRVNYYAQPLTVGIDPSGDAWTFNIPVPDPVQLYELRAEFQPGVAEWLRGVLERSFETPEERNTRERARHEALRSANGYGIAPRAGITFDDIREGLRRHRRPELNLDEDEDRWGAARSLYENQVRGVIPADVAEMFDLDPETMARVAEAGRRAGEGIRSLTEAFQRNEEAITSTRAEFPHDPYNYGRIYPGDQGASRWTPPDDPNEKIRSCP